MGNPFDSAQDGTRCSQGMPVDQMHENAYYGIPISAFGSSRMRGTAAFD